MEYAKVGEFTVAKFGEAERLVFGWGKLSVTTDGHQYADTQGDVVDADVLEKAAYNFVLDYRDTGEMHAGEPTGTLVESVMFTEEKLAAMGIAKGVVPIGWWLGFKVQPETFAKVEKGELQMFSIYGTAQRVPC